MKMSRVVPALITALAWIGVPALSEARDRPGTPTNPVATALSPSCLGLQWFNTTRDDETVTFEVNLTKDGVPLGTYLLDGQLGVKGGRDGNTICKLEPDARYCMRVWTRYVDNDVRSAQPSALACANLPPAPPLAPLDVVVTLALNGKLAQLQWNTPDQSAHRRITRYEVERQSPPGPDRPTLPEGSVAGPDGAQTTKTKLAFSFTTGELDPALKHGFRVCSVNGGGRTCAKFVMATAAAINVHKLDRQPLAAQPDTGRNLNLQPARPLPAIAPATAVPPPAKQAGAALVPTPAVATGKAASAPTSLGQVAPIPSPRPMPGWSPPLKVLAPVPLPPPPDKRLGGAGPSIRALVPHAPASGGLGSGGGGGGSTQ